MDENVEQNINEISSPKFKGKFVFKDIQEGNGEPGTSRISFNPPLVVEYSIWEKKDAKTNKENYSEDAVMMGFFTYDFGMDAKVSIDINKNFLMNGYSDLTPESHPVDVLMKTIWFDLFHAFTHTELDPNYGHYHWALVGWLDERATVSEA